MLRRVVGWALVALLIFGVATRPHPLPAGE